MAIIVEDSLQKTTLRDVAQRAGVSTGTLVYYFRDRENPVDARVCHEEVVWAKLKAISKAPPSPRRSSGGK